MTKTLLHIAIARPLRQLYSYLAPADYQGEFQAGQRISVPFGGEKISIGILIASENFVGDSSKFKTALQIIDEQPILSAQLLELLQWLSDYYQHPIGETLATALPAALKKGQVLEPLQQHELQLSPAGLAYTPSSRAHTQHAILDALRKKGTLNDVDCKQLALKTSGIKLLIEKGYILEQWRNIEACKTVDVNNKLQLNAEQSDCLEAFNQQISGFRPILLEGITGSGKTEVYLQAIEQVLLAGKQVLVLVPEIGLTPQTVGRFQQRFNCPVISLHSNLTEKARLLCWQQADAGIARIIIGTRSALFTPSRDLGLIIVDEEHDLSYKQQDGLRYSARDAAVMRAKIADIPIILGSATPSLETLNNALCGRFEHWQLTQRAANAKPAKLQLLDIRHQSMHEGISAQALPYIHDCISRGEQALIFINRRGFAPTLLCHDCGWVSLCDGCDQKMTTHLKAGHLRCHQCQSISAIPQQCPQCHSSKLIFQGAGTQRIEAFLQQQFPDTSTYRIDRDSTKNQQQMDAVLEKIQENQPAILIGTQMLSKGHHFANVTLVLMLEADNGLMGTDYRAMERFGQLLTQVTGRAGREEKQGLALIQSHYPEHPELNQLLSYGYHNFAKNLLAQRQQLQLPPFSFQALIRMEAASADEAMASLSALQQSLATLRLPQLLSIGPYPAALQRRAHFYRYQLLLQAPSRAELRHAVSHVIRQSKGIIRHHSQRFSIDIDPQDMS